MEDTLRQEEEIRRQKEAELDQKLKRATTVRLKFFCLSLNL